MSALCVCVCGRPLSVSSLSVCGGLGYLHGNADGHSRDAPRAAAAHSPAGPASNVAENVGQGALLRLVPGQQLGVELDLHLVETAILQKQTDRQTDGTSIIHPSLCVLDGWMDGCVCVYVEVFADE